MDLVQAFILGLLQGATEFIPVSSLGHLTLVPWLLDWEFDPVLKNAFDVMAHWGTLVAVLAVFWHDLWGLAQGWLRTVVSSPHSLGGLWDRLRGDVQGHLAWLILIGSIPATVLGLALESFFEMLFGTPPVVSALLLVTAALLAFSEWRGRQGRELEKLTWLDALLIGLGQAVAIAPGISRSGATMASGLLRGVRREAAARFSFLLSTPVILGAGLWQLKDLFASSGWAVHLSPLVVGFVVSALAGYACIRFLLGYLRRGRLYPFAAYCALAGTACLVIWLVR